MKMIIFMILMGLVILGMVWFMRKSQAKEELARQQSIKRLKEPRKDALTLKEPATWPTIVQTAGAQASGAVLEANDLGQEQAAEELSMTSIEYEPSKHASA